MDNILISFCIPTYNRSLFLKKCIESIIAYKNQDIEIVIQDNCSPDSTKEVVDSFSDNRIRYYKNDANIGSIKNFLTLIPKAKGKYVFFITDDDFLLPGAVDEIKNFINKYNPEYFKQDTIVYLEKSKKARLNSISSGNIIQPNYAEIARILIASCGGTGVCFEKDKLDYDFIWENGKENYYPTMLIAGSFGKKVSYLAIPVAIHIWENETFWGIDPDHRELLDRHQAEVLLVLKNKFDPSGYKELIREYFKHHPHNLHTILLHLFPLNERAFLYSKFFFRKKLFPKIISWVKNISNPIKK